MDFSSAEDLPLKREGDQVYYVENNSAFYYGKKIDRFYIRFQKIKDVLHKFEVMVGLVFGVGFFALFAWQLVESNAVGEVFSLQYWSQSGNSELFFFWLGVLAILFLIYKTVVIRTKEMQALKHNFDEEQKQNNAAQARNLSDQEKKDISTHFTVESREVLSNAYRIADDKQSPQLNLFHIFYSLLENVKIANIFVRLGVPPSRAQEIISSAFNEQKDSKPEVASSFYQVVFHAYKIAKKDEQEFVDVTELILAVVKKSSKLQELLYDLEIDSEKLHNVIEWVRIREKLRRDYQKQRKKAALVSDHGIDRAMTATATPYLNKFSQDITLAAKHGNLEPCVARDDKIKEAFRMLTGGQNGVLLVGERGVGKSTIIEGIAQKIIEDDVPDMLKEKRMVKLSISQLVAGVSVSGAQKRLINILREVKKAGNVVLFIDGVHELLGAESKQDQGIDVASTLAEFLGGQNFITFATTTPQGYNQNILNTQLDSALSEMKVPELEKNQAIQVLESKAGMIEYQQNVYFSYDAIEQAVVLSNKFIQSKVLPQSALNIMKEAASLSRSNKGEKSLVSAEDVAEIISDKTGVNATSVTEDESKKLLKLEEKLHERVVGQDMAVDLVANALRRARADVRSEDKPISTFLFLGPTGVGKTELAKTIASTYFGDEDKMTRIDMSEYQDRSAIYRLIGQPDQQGTGILTEAVRENPFSLILLDELEKANKDVRNLFLQVFDDGRLTDSVGREIDFTNTIIISTSNSGTDYVQKKMQEGMELEQIRQKLIRGKLKQQYPPEFLNRFDGIVLFKSLTREEVKKIADLMLDRVRADMENKGVEFEVTEGALEDLVEEGYDPEFGARPMQRAIQNNVENKLAELVLSDKLDRRDKVIMKKEFETDIEKR